jgi:hypothetical protein
MSMFDEHTQKKMFSTTLIDHKTKPLLLFHSVLQLVTESHNYTTSYHRLVVIQNELLG